MGTLILHVTYHGLQTFNGLRGRAKYAKGKVHGFRICYVSPRHPPHAGDPIIDKISFDPPTTQHIFLNYWL